MKTLIIYDNEGKIFSQVCGNYIIPNGGVQYLEFEMPQNKILKGIDLSTEPHQPIFEDIPPTEIDILKTQNETLGQTLADITLQNADLLIQMQTLSQTVAEMQLSEIQLGGM